MSTWTSKQQILTGTGLVNVSSSPIMIDLRRFHFGITTAVILSAGGAASYKVQNSFDPQEPNSPNKGQPLNWIDHDIIIAGTTVSAASNLAFPATFIRLVAASLTGTLTLYLVEGIGTS